jgi:hypothetical protein
VAGTVPLTTQLSWAWVAFTIETDNAVEADGEQQSRRLFRLSLAMWANGLRLIGEEGVTVGELRAQAGAACNIGGLERWGWVSVGEPSPRRREGYGTHRGVKEATVLRPTTAGSLARRLWPSQLAAVEARWQARFGPEVVAGLRKALFPYAHDMPWSPPEVHPSDGFFTHVAPGARPEPREDAPLASLMGQALTALTLEHERGAEVSLPLAANVMRVIGPGTVPLRELPSQAGISKEAVAMAVNFLVRRRLAEQVDRSVKLNAVGLDALDGYQVRVTRSRDEPLQAALEAVLSRREVLATGLEPLPGCWRGEKPYLAQTRRVLADLPGALPWHPMVLHRGGWPDGS